MVKAHPGGGVGLGPEGLPGALEPRLLLLQPPLADQRAAEHRIGEAGDLVLAPAVPLSQLYRLPAPSLSQRIAHARD